MFDIILWDFKKKTNSTAQPSQTGTTLECRVMTPSNIINPTIELKASPLGYNYAYIPSWGRYYFIDDIQFVSGAYIISLSVDVLASYKAQIGSDTAYILRSASDSDGQIIDTLYPSKSDVVKTLSYANSKGYSWTDFSAGAYVIGVQGLDMAGAGIIYYYLTPANFILLLHNFYANSGNGSWWGNLTKGVIDSIYNITDFISSCRWYPVIPDITGITPEPIYLGSFQTNAQGYRMRGNSYPRITRTFQLPAHPQAGTRGEYLNVSSYTRRVLIDPLIGSYTVNNADFSNLEIEPSLGNDILIDFTTGQALYTLYGNDVGTNTKPIYHNYINFGIDIELGESIVNVGGMLSAVGEMAGNALIGDWLGVASNIGSMASQIVPANRSAYSNGGFVQLIGDPVLISYFQLLVDEDQANKGRPLCQLRQINTLSGYMIIDNPHFSGAMLNDENNMINNYMAGGFYYE